MGWISVARLRRLSTEDIYRLLLPQIEELYGKYSYIPLAKEQYDDVILNSIETIVYDAKSRDISTDAFVHKIDTCLKEYLDSLGLLDPKDDFFSHREVATIKLSVKNPVLSKQEERECILRAQHGDKNAMEKLIYSNHGLLNLMARRMLEHSGSEQCDLEDFYQEAVLTLYEVIKKFDVEKGFCFSTYLSNAIHNNLIQYIGVRDEMVINAYQERISFKQIYENFLEITDKPSLQKIADIIGIPYETAKFYYNTLYPLHFHDIVDEEGNTLADTIEDDTIEFFGRNVVNEQLREALEEVLVTLPLKKQKIIKLHYGLADGESHKQTEIAKQYNVTRKAISKSNAEALHELSKKRRLKNFL